MDKHYYKVYEEEKNGKLKFYVAHWNEESGHYEYPGPGTSTCFGPLNYAGAEFSDLEKARRHARYMNAPSPTK